MTESIYLETIKPVNCCGLVGVEKIVSSHALGDERITITIDNFKQYRIIIQDRRTKTVKSGIVFDQFRKVRFKYTRPEYRGQRLTKQLFAYIQIQTGKRFYHSEFLTESGKAAI